MDNEKQPVVGIAWCGGTDSAIARSIETAGGTALFLPQVLCEDLPFDKNGNLLSGKDKNGVLTLEAAEKVKRKLWQTSNAAAVMEGVDAVVFPGGGDISPSLYRNPMPWCAELFGGCCAERDVSDYLLMSFCLDHDIPVLCVCRGTQLLGVVSGAKMIPDLPRLFESKGLSPNFEHRGPNGKTPHDVRVLSRDSLLYRIAKRDLISGCPSSHHQAVGSVEGTLLALTGAGDPGGLAVTEVIERADKRFVLGVQFHPEYAVSMQLDNSEEKDDYMSLDDALMFFRALVNAAQEPTLYRR